MHVDKLSRVEQCSAKMRGTEISNFVIPLFVIIEKCYTGNTRSRWANEKQFLNYSTIIHHSINSTILSETPVSYWLVYI